MYITVTAGDSSCRWILKLESCFKMLTCNNCKYLIFFLWSPFFVFVQQRLSTATKGPRPAFLCPASVYLWFHVLCKLLRRKFCNSTKWDLPPPSSNGAFSSMSLWTDNVKKGWKEFLLFTPVFQLRVLVAEPFLFYFSSPVCHIVQSLTLLPEQRGVNEAENPFTDKPYLLRTTMWQTWKENCLLKLVQSCSRRLWKQRAERRLCYCVIYQLDFNISLFLK